MGQWYQFLIDWLTQHPQWLGLILLVAACVECLAVVGLLVPGTVLLFTLACWPAAACSAWVRPCCWASSVA